MEELAASQPRSTRFPGEVAWKAGVIGAVLAFLSSYPLPAQQTWLTCGFHWLTGRPCPFCGITRSLSFLARGQWEVAVRFHPLGPLVFGLLLATFFLAAFQLVFPKARHIAASRTTRRMFWGSCVVLFVVCGVLRLILPMDI